MTKYGGSVEAWNGRRHHKRYPSFKNRSHLRYCLEGPRGGATGKDRGGGEAGETLEGRRVDRLEVHELLDGALLCDDHLVDDAGEACTISNSRNTTPGPHGSTPRHVS